VGAAGLRDQATRRRAPREKTVRALQTLIEQCNCVIFCSPFAVRKCQAAAYFTPVVGRRITKVIREKPDWPAAGMGFVCAAQRVSVWKISV